MAADWETSEKRVMAINSAHKDQGLIDQLAELGVSRAQINRIIGELHQFNREGATCSEIRNLIRNRLGKNKRANKLAQGYRRNMASWINGEDGYRFAPSFEVQSLPELSVDNLPQYLGLFDGMSTDADIQNQRRIILNAMGDGGPFNEASAYVNAIKMQESPELEKEFIDSAHSSIDSWSPIMFQHKTLEHKLLNFIRSNEQASMTTLLHILNVCSENEDLLICYDRLLSESLNTLTQNNHFTKSLFHLVDRNLSGKKVPQRLNHRVLRFIVNALYEVGVCSPYRFVDEKDNIDQPRDASTFEFRFYDLDPDTEFNYADATFSAPIDNVPTHWNGHRIVNPAKSPTFKRFSKAVESADLEAFLSDTEDELQDYIEGLKNERRYALEFSRINVTEMPGLEGFDIWFHYFRDESMPSGQIGVEVIVDGASLVYFLNPDGELIMKSAGNLMPSRPSHDAFETESLDPNPTNFPFTRAVWQAVRQGRNPIEALLGARSAPKAWDHFQRDDLRSIDHLYGDTTVRKWTNPEVLKFLKFYFIKYAYYLLVQPRTVGNSQGDSGTNENEENFGLCLSEYQSEVTIPNNSGFTQNGELGSRITIFHGVTGHIRKLPAGQNPSQEAVAAAEEHGIVLLPGQTFVRPHTRGGVVAGQYTSEKKVNSD